MKIERVRISQLGKRQRKVEPRGLMATETWANLTRELQSGLKRGEAVRFSLTPDDLKKFEIKSLKAAVRPIKRFVKANYPRYSVEAIHTAEGAEIQIFYDEPVTKARSA